MSESLQNAGVGKVNKGKTEDVHVEHTRKKGLYQVVMLDRRE